MLWFAKVLISRIANFCKFCEPVFRYLLGSFSSSFNLFCLELVHICETLESKIWWYQNFYLPLQVK